tara:strand:+ start:80 stop:1213 length:1134 start_codon:yes stop_codon:yes gene_type:complete
MEITPLIKEDYVVLQDEATVSELIGKMKQKEKRSALIFRNKKYLGLIEKKGLLHSKMDVTNTKLKNHIQNTPLLNEHADVIETAYLMFQSNLDLIPVERNKEIVGIIKAFDVAKLAADLPETESWKVNDIKLVKSVRINKDDPISKAIELMHAKKVDHLPVFESGKLYGIITYKDVLRRYLNWSPKRDVSAKFNQIASAKTVELDFPKIASLPVSDFSTNDNLAIVNSSLNLKKAIELMKEKGVPSLIVQDQEEVLGLLTAKNILAKVGSLKTPVNYNIKFVGLKDLKLDEFEEDNLKKIAANEAFKLQRKIKNEFSLVLHLKSYEKDGHRQKYSISLRVEYPGQALSTSEDDWDFETALRKTFNNAKNALDKKFKD